jgi:hypothetical protein
MHEIAHQADSPSIAPARKAAVILVAFALFGFCIAALAIYSMDSVMPATHRDFISYWAAGQLLLQHSNPYDAPAVFRVEKSAGFPLDEPLVMRNPPFSLVLVLPLGALSPHPAAVLWIACMIASLIISINVLFSVYGKPDNSLHMLLYAFAPIVSCMRMGQTSTFSLLGITLFLYWRSRRPFCAGLVLPLIFIKPHLLMPFGIVLLLWLVKERTWPALTGAATVVAFAMAIAISFDPQICSHYIPVLRSANADTVWIPTVSTLVRHWPFRNAAWAQYFVALIACLWGIWYFWRHRYGWDWLTHGSLLLLVSVWAAPYSWFQDEVILAPALLHAAYLCLGRTRPLVVIVILDGIALALLLFWEIPLASGFFAWTTSAWLGWYLYATRDRSSTTVAIA